MAKVERLFADRGRALTVTRAGSLFNLHLADGPIRSSADVRAADAATLRDLHLALLGHGILFTERGMGCLSTPMTASEVDAFVAAAGRALDKLDAP